MLLTSIFTGFVNLYLNSWYTGKTLNYTFWKQLRDIAPSYFTATIIALAVYFLKYLVLPDYLILIFQLLLGFFVGVVISEFLKFNEYIEIKTILINVKNQINQL